MTFMLKQCSSAFDTIASYVQETIDEYIKKTDDKKIIIPKYEDEGLNQTNFYTNSFYESRQLNYVDSNDKMKKLFLNKLKKNYGKLFNYMKENIDRFDNEGDLLAHYMYEVKNVRSEKVAAKIFDNPKTSFLILIIDIFGELSFNKKFVHSNTEDARIERKKRIQNQILVSEDQQQKMGGHALKLNFKDLNITMMYIKNLCDKLMINSGTDKICRLDLFGFLNDKINNEEIKKLSNTVKINGNVIDKEEYLIHTCVSWASSYYIYMINFLLEEIQDDRTNLCKVIDHLHELKFEISKKDKLNRELSKKLSKLRKTEKYIKKIDELETQLNSSNELNRKLTDKVNSFQKEKDREFYSINKENVALHNKVKSLENTNELLNKELSLIRNYVFNLESEDFEIKEINYKQEIIDELKNKSILIVGNTNKWRDMIKDELEDLNITSMSGVNKTFNRNMVHSKDVIILNINDQFTHSTSGKILINVKNDVKVILTNKNNFDLFYQEVYEQLKRG